MNLTEAEILARALILEHLPGWRFAWSREKTAFGRTHFGPQDSTGKCLTRTINLSKPLTLLNDKPLVEWVVKHEIAHGLAGPDAVDHGPVWRSHARALGIKPTRCWTSSGFDAVKIEGKVLGTCKNRCGYVTRQHKITYSAYNHVICPTCSDRRRKRWVKLDWTRDGQPLVSPKKPKPRKRARRYA